MYPGHARKFSVYIQILIFDKKLSSKNYFKTYLHYIMKIYLVVGEKIILEEFFSF